MTVSTLTIDFSKTPDHRQHKSGKLREKIPSGERPRSADGKLLTPKQIRARARRRANRGYSLSTQEMDILYHKPIEEWDLEELARGRTRAPDGTFKGPQPKWINRQVHEMSMDRFKAAIKSDMNATTIDAMTAIRGILNNEEVDEKGKPVVPASTKIDAAKFLLEHVVGKPKQVLEADVSVQLQSILAVVMANPAETLMSRETGGLGYTLGHMPGITMPLGIAADAEDADIIDGEIVDDTEDDDDELTYTTDR